MEYNIKPTKPPRQEGGFPQTIPQLIQKYKLDSMWEEITKTVKDIIQQELGQKALKGTSLTVKGTDGEEGFIQVLDKEDKPIVEINNSGVEVGEGKTITEGGSEVSKSVEWEDVKNKPNVFKPETHTHTKSEISDFAHTHSEYKLKDDFAVIEVEDPSAEIPQPYPEGFNMSNCTVVCIMFKSRIDENTYSVWQFDNENTCYVNLRTDQIGISSKGLGGIYRIVLMKIE